jgi:hypothetical protein
MSDREQFVAMLDRAGIPHLEHPTEREFAPADALSVECGDLSYLDKRPRPLKHQPFPGGYDGFYAEMVFASDGNLLAVWAWE